MEPTYRNNSFAFCWRLQYHYSALKRGDVVAVRFAGTNVMLLKRIVGLSGDTSALRKGQLIVNGKAVDEPYVVHTSKWQLEERTVAPGHVYLLGDNRGTPMRQHKFGQVDVDIIIGAVIP